jgi:PhnB protein
MGLNLFAFIFTKNKLTIKLLKMAQVNPYLVFNGNCSQAFHFYKLVFGGEFNMLAQFKDMPTQEGCEPMSAELGEKVMHVSYNIGNTLLMGSDANPMQGDVVFGQNVSLSINAESKEEADKIFNALAADGQITMPIDNTFWGAYFGMLTDKFGMMWMVNFDEMPKEK